MVRFLFAFVLLTTLALAGSVTFKQELNQDTGTPGDIVTTNGAVTITGTATAGSIVTVMDYGTPLGPAAVSGTGYALRATLPVGYHQLYGLATLYGKTAFSNVGQQIEIQAAIPLVLSGLKQVFNAKTQQVQISGTTALYTITAQGLPSTTVQILQGETVIATATVYPSPAGGFLAVATLPPGAYSLVVRATSASGASVDAALPAISVSP